MMEETRRGIPGTCGLLAVLVLAATLGWGRPASSQSAEGMLPEHVSLHDLSEGVRDDGGVHPANRSGLSGARFPTGELLDLGLPRHLVDIGRKATFRAMQRSRRPAVTAVESFWGGWAGLVLAPRGATSAGDVTAGALRESTVRYTEADVLNVLQPLRNPDPMRNCAFTGPDTPGCLSVGTLAATLLEVCRIDAVFQHTLRVLPFDSARTAPKPPAGTDERDFHWANGWLSGNGAAFRRAPWNERQRAPSVPWLADESGRLLDDQAIRRMCRRASTDTQAARRIAAWLSTSADQSMHRAHQAASMLLREDPPPGPFDWLRAREWAVLLRATGAAHFDLVLVNVARQQLRVLDIRDGRLQTQREQGTEYKVIVGTRVNGDPEWNRTPLMLAQFNPRDAYQAWPRYQRTRPLEGAFRCERAGERPFWSLLHGPRNPFGVFKLTPTPIGGLAHEWGWAPAGGRRASLTPVPHYYIHGTNREDRFTSLDGSRTFSSGCVRAERRFLDEVVHGRWVAEPPVCRDDTPSSDAHQCWRGEDGANGCTDRKVKTDVCLGRFPEGAQPYCPGPTALSECREVSRALTRQGECLRDVPLTLEANVPLYLLFAYFSGGGPGSTGSDPYDLDKGVVDWIARFADAEIAPVLEFRGLPPPEASAPGEDPPFEDLDLEQDGRLEGLQH